MSEKAKREKNPIIVSEKRDFKGVWVPAKLYLSTELAPNEKFVLLEIYSLTSKKNRECFANNKHFADFVGLKENTIQKMMSKIEKKGYIERNYEYKENSKEIAKRTLKLTKKFFDDFINEKTEEEGEKENADDVAENNPCGGGLKSTSPMDLNQPGGGLKSTDKYNNNKYNNILSNTDLSNPKKEHTVAGATERKEHTVISDGNKLHVESQTEKYLLLKEKETDMLKRVILISKKHYPGSIVKEIFLTIEHFLRLYTAKTGKVHPILTDDTLESIIDKIANFRDDEYGHFGYVIEEPGDFMMIVDEYFNTNFGEINGGEVNYRLPHFVSDEILSRLAQRVIEY